LLRVTDDLRVYDEVVTAPLVVIPIAEHGLAVDVLYETRLAAAVLLV
jgi:hypothetical protein